MISRLLFRLSSQLPCRIIDDNGKAYLERYYVGQIFGATIYLHRFVASDPDRGLHDHPWSWARSLVLSGYYFEETRSGTHPVRWYNRLTGDSFHRVLVPESCGEVWTLFAHGPYVKQWGFWKKCEIYKTSILHPSGERAASGGVWTPFENTGSDGKSKWWERAPKGRDFQSRKMPMTQVPPKSAPLKDEQITMIKGWVPKQRNWPEPPNYTKE